MIHKSFFSKKDIIVFTLLACMLVWGLWLNNWWGGFLFGTGAVAIFLATVGKSVAYKKLSDIERKRSTQK